MTTMSDTQQNRQQNRGGGNRRPRRNNSNSNSNNNNRNRNRNRNRAPRKPKPLKLTLWQKILKAIGLFDEEKARKKQQQAERKEQSAKKSTNTQPKSNTRNAKTSSGSGKRAPQKVPVESARLYVGNLSYDATEYDIEDLFKGVGTVKKVEIIYNRNTHKSKGYGFVQMLNTEEAMRAVEVLHDQPFMGRQLVVNGSKSRKDGDPANEEENSEVSSAS